MNAPDMPFFDSEPRPLLPTGRRRLVCGVRHCHQRRRLFADRAVLPNLSIQNKVRLNSRTKSFFVPFPHPTTSFSPSTMNFQKTILALVVASATAFAPLPMIQQQRAVSTSLFGAVEDRVKEIIASQLSVDASKVVPAATFVDDLGADSLDTVELIMAIEEEFDCEIPEEEAANISTVQEVIDYVSKL
jgi:acyl carrier protein